MKKNRKLDQRLATLSTASENGAQVRTATTTCTDFPTATRHCHCPTGVAFSYRTPKNRHLWIMTTDYIVQKCIAYNIDYCGYCNRQYMYANKYSTLYAVHFPQRNLSSLSRGVRMSEKRPPNKPRVHMSSTSSSTVEFLGRVGTTTGRIGISRTTTCSSKTCWGVTKQCRGEKN